MIPMLWPSVKGKTKDDLSGVTSREAEVEQVKHREYLESKTKLCRFMTHGRCEVTNEWWFLIVVFVVIHYIVVDYYCYRNGEKWPCRYQGRKGQK